MVARSVLGRRIFERSNRAPMVVLVRLIAPKRDSFWLPSRAELTSSRFAAVAESMLMRELVPLAYSTRIDCAAKLCGDEGREERRGQRREEVRGGSEGGEKKMRVK
jgi:hypothetical protein